MTRRPVVADLAVGNLGGAAKPPLNRFLSTPLGDPDVIFLTEAYRCGSYASAWGRQNGYQFVRGSADKHGWEARSVAMLVKPEARWWAVDKMDEHWWWGPNRNKRREPRCILKAGSNVGPVACIHNAPKDPKNRTARREGDAAYRELLRKGFVVAGDFNGGHAETVESVVKPIGGGYVTTGKVDGVAFGPQWRFVTKADVSDSPEGHGWGIVRLTTE